MLARRAALAVALGACSFPPGAVAAAQSATLHVGLSPARAGASTTIAFGFQIAAPGGLPPALTRLRVHLPAGMAVDTRDLATCTRAALLARGPRGCPRNARVGAGSVLAEVPLGDVVRPERATLTVFNAPRRGARTALLFYAAGRLPIATRLIFPAVILTGRGGLTIAASIPLIPTLPEAPDAAIVAMSSTLGTRQLAYYRTVAGRRVRFVPKGATLPARCPAGGLAFAADFAFGDASTTNAAATVPCRA